jgi:hypothetical protein
MKIYRNQFSYILLGLTQGSTPDRWMLSRAFVHTHVIMHAFYQDVCMW